MTAINRILATALADKSPAISLQTYHKIGSGVFATVFTTERPNYTKEQITDGLSRMFSGAFSLVEGSLFDMNSQYYNMYRAVVTANVESHEFTDERVKSLGLKLTTANVFIDEQDLVWKVMGDGENRRLVLTSVDDYDTILASKKSRQLVTSSADGGVDYAFGDYVVFFNVASHAIDGGYAVNDRQVLARSTGEVVAVDRYAVLESAVGSSLGTDHLQLDIANLEVLSSMDKTSTAAFLDYWRQLYGNTAVYTEIERAMLKYAM